MNKIVSTFVPYNKVELRECKHTYAKHSRNDSMSYRCEHVL